MDPHTKAMTTAEELRQVIREANEARADLAAQTKQARAHLSLFTKEFLDGYETMVRSKIREDVENAFKSIAEARDDVLAVHAEVQQQIDGVRESIATQIAGLAGKSPEEIINLITASGLTVFREAMIKGMDEEIVNQVKLRLAGRNRQSGKRRR